MVYFLWVQVIQSQLEITCSVLIVSKNLGVTEEKIPNINIYILLTGLTYFVCYERIWENLYQDELLRLHL